MHSNVSPRLAAQALGVSESSLKRWTDQGLLPATTTAGGHRRIPVSGLVKFARDHGHPIARPEMLGLAAGETVGRASPRALLDTLMERLLTGDEDAVRRLILNAFVDGMAVASLIDHVVAPCFSALGIGCADGRFDIYEEHRASEIMLRVLNDLGRLLPLPRQGAPLALGATLSGDRYTLPLRCVELVLREAGLAVTNLGCDLPVQSFVAAIERLSPRVVFLSVSAVASKRSFLGAYAELWRVCSARGVFVLLGGSALDATLRSELRYGAAPESLERLVDLVRPLVG